MVVVVLVILMVVVLGFSLWLGWLWWWWWVVVVVVVGGEGNVVTWSCLVAVGIGVDGKQNYCALLLHSRSALPLQFMSALLLCSR